MAGGSLNRLSAPRRLWRLATNIHLVTSRGIKKFLKIAWKQEIGRKGGDSTRENCRWVDFVGEKAEEALESRLVQRCPVLQNSCAITPPTVICLSISALHFPPLMSCIDTLDCSQASLHLTSYLNTEHLIAKNVMYYCSGSNRCGSYKSMYMEVYLVFYFKKNSQLTQISNVNV